MKPSAREENFCQVYWSWRSFVSDCNVKDITTVSQYSIRALTCKITGFKISDVPGENL